MKLFNLYRLPASLECSCGVLAYQFQPVCLTLELPWKDNKRSISSIPVGLYRCARYNSERYKSTFQILEVPNRTHILFHAGNTVFNTSGCILLGSTFGTLYNNPAILNSQTAIKKFMKLVKNDKEFLLKISGG